MVQSGYSRTLIGGLLLAGCGLVAPDPVIGAAASQPAQAPQLLLASSLHASIEPAPYLVSEKYDGVRALWDGHELRFRSGRRIAAPAWFLQRLPDQALDGELWLGRGQFDALSGLVRGADADDPRWHQVRYMVFELPGASGSFAERVARIGQIVEAAGWTQLRAVPQQRLIDRPALDRLFRQTVAAGGEGLMLHLATAPYSTGRGDSLIKLKPQQDAEAVVIGHRAGRGKYAGKLGAVRLRAGDGQMFWIGTGFSDAERQDPPAIGSTVTYRFRELTPSGKPRFASFLRVRDDL